MIVAKKAIQKIKHRHVGEVGIVLVHKRLPWPGFEQMRRQGVVGTEIEVIFPSILKKLLRSQKLHNLDKLVIVVLTA